MNRWLKVNRVILANSSSLVATTLITALLGFAYWWLAARLFPSSAVGFASAAISAMLLLGMIGVLGLGTLLIGELPRQPAKSMSLITTALVVSGLTGAILGSAFAVLAPHFLRNLKPLATSPAGVALFALGVSLTASTLVLDQALVGLLRGELQFARNALLATAKLALILVAGMWSRHDLGMTIYATWLVGVLVSLAGLSIYAVRHGCRLSSLRPEWKLVRELRHTALWHHALNLALQVPNMALPLVVTAQLSISMNAYFYTAWMLASFVFVVPSALTTMLFSIGVAEIDALKHKMKLTVMISLAISVLANVALFPCAYYVMRLFGVAYALHGAWCLRILGLAVFPLIVKTHYIAITRVFGQMARASLFIAIGGCLELILALAGVHFGGLSGLSLGWSFALCIEAAFMGRTVYRAATSKAHISRGVIPCENTDYHVA